MAGLDPGARRIRPPRYTWRSGSGELRGCLAGGAAALSDSALRALAQTPGQEITFTCVPPGQGTRLAVARAPSSIAGKHPRPRGRPRVPPGAGLAGAIAGAMRVLRRRQSL